MHGKRAPNRLALLCQLSNIVRNRICETTRIYGQFTFLETAFLQFLPGQNKSGPKSCFGPDEGFITLADYWMTRVNVVEWLKLPLVPVMVRVRVPVDALLLTRTDRVEVPE